MCTVFESSFQPFSLAKKFYIKKIYVMIENNLASMTACKIFASPVKFFMINGHFFHLETIIFAVLQ